MKNIMEKPILKVESNMSYIIKGIVLSIIFTLVSLLIFAAILSYTELSENTISPVIIIISAFSILIGSSISTIKIKKYGLLNGAIVGRSLYYAIILYI